MTARRSRNRSNWYGSAISGLSPLSKRTNARRLAVNAAWLAYHNRDRVHYTQDARRWQGIDRGLKAWKGQYPTYADCSSFATWCIWNGLDHYGVRDVVNGAAWKAGWTGTMLDHGKEAINGHYLEGDCVIYGSNPGRHTAIIVGFDANRRPMVISHGSEAGPYYLPYNYRSDINSIRRYI